MRKLILLAALLGTAFTATAADAQRRWDWNRRDRTVIIEQQPLVNTNTLAIILALEAARRASETETLVQPRRAAPREYVPLK